MLCRYFALKNFFSGNTMEVLESLNKVAYIALKVPDHAVAACVFEVIGVFNKMIGNEKGSIEAFQQLRDIGEDCRNH
jgi:hypothetical protein